MALDLQNYVDALLAKANAEDADRYGQMALGGLMGVLSLLPGDMPVSFDTGEMPGRFRSYRGIYAQLALDTSGSSATVAKLLEECGRANGTVMEGYEGGDFKMTRATWLNKAEYGCCGDKIVGVSVVDGGLTIATAQNED